MIYALPDWGSWVSVARPSGYLTDPEKEKLVAIICGEFPLGRKNFRHNFKGIAWIDLQEGNLVAVRIKEERKNYAPMIETFYLKWSRTTDGEFKLESHSRRSTDYQPRADGDDTPSLIFKDQAVLNDLSRKLQEFDNERERKSDIVLAVNELTEPLRDKLQEFLIEDRRIEFLEKGGSEDQWRKNKKAKEVARQYPHGVRRALTLLLEAGVEVGGKTVGEIIERAEVLGWKAEKDDSDQSFLERLTEVIL